MGNDDQNRESAGSSDRRRGPLSSSSGTTFCLIGRAAGHSQATGAAAAAHSSFRLHVNGHVTCWSRHSTRSKASREPMNTTENGDMRGDRRPRRAVESPYFDEEWSGDVASLHPPQRMILL